MERNKQNSGSALQPIARERLAEYVGRPIFIQDSDAKAHRRWLRGFEDIGHDTVVVCERRSGPWLSEYGWSWQAWAKMPTLEDMKAHQLGHAEGLPAPGAREFFKRRAEHENT